MSAPEGTVGVVGLGYVGLPLAVALAAHRGVVAHDINPRLLASLREGVDPSGEVSGDILALIDDNLAFTQDPSALAEAEAVLVAVPTPIDATRRPDLSALRAATAVVGRHLAEGALVVYESTVYPGCTEDVCLPILERESGMRCDVDFELAYSPERVSPGDAARTLRNVDKLVGARTPRGLERALDLYRGVVDAPVHPVNSIRVAEAAKVLENVQRDLNIALMNECALIFDRAGIDTNAVIDAASSKWNFHAYRPGMVGGHCIGVDPYYLTHMAELLGYHPEVILAGRRINDEMGRFVASKTVRELIRRHKVVAGARVAVLGVTFKEDVPDVRNTRVVDLVSELRAHGVEVSLCDPLADPDQVRGAFGGELVSLSALVDLDAVVFAVPHAEYRGLDLEELRVRCGDAPVIIDVRGVVDRDAATRLGFRLWRL